MALKAPPASQAGAAAPRRRCARVAPAALRFGALFVAALLLARCCSCAAAAAPADPTAPGAAPRRLLHAPPPTGLPPQPPPRRTESEVKQSPVATVAGAVGGTVAALLCVGLLLRRRAQRAAAVHAELAALAEAKARAGDPVAGLPVPALSPGLSSLQRSVDALQITLMRQHAAGGAARARGRAVKRWDVFLSYRREDYAIVDVIADKLTLAGFRVFVDRHGAMAGKPFDNELFAAIAASSAFTPVITLAALQALGAGSNRDQEGCADFALGESLAALHLFRCGALPLIYPLLVGPEVASTTDVRGTDWAPLLGTEAFRKARAALSEEPHAPTLALVEALCKRHRGTPPLAEDLLRASVRDLVCGHYSTARADAPPEEPPPGLPTPGLLSFDACILLGPTRDIDLHIRSRFAAHLRAALRRVAGGADTETDDDSSSDVGSLASAHLAQQQRTGVSRVVAESAPEALIPWADIALGEPLGQGSFGTVHAAVWSDVPVAVKLLSLVAPPRHVLRQLQREGYVMASLRHPHICACFGLIVDPPRFGLVLEHCTGGTICDALLDDTVPLTLQQRCRWGAQLATGMAYLHTRPAPLGAVVHGDLKSANLLVQQPGDMLKIGDFGLSKLRAMTTSSGTAAAAAMVAGGACTVGWTAPEVLAAYDARLTLASDMYAFGVVLWELAARQLPWGRMTAGEVIDLVKAKAQRPPLPQDCPPALGKLITRCWAQAPEKRYASFDDPGRVLAALAAKAGVEAIAE
jgi:hypothetical protein